MAGRSGDGPLLDVGCRRRGGEPGAQAVPGENLTGSPDMPRAFAISPEIQSSFLVLNGCSG